MGKEGKLRSCMGCKDPGKHCVEYDTPDDQLIRGVVLEDGEIGACPLPFIEAAGGDIQEFEPIRFND